MIDAVLAAALILFALYALETRDLRKAVISFIAFGLLSALAWARLRAPDIALVEAAVGTGLTGALLMGALSWATSAPTRERPRARPVGWLLAALVAPALGLALTTIAASPPPSPALARAMSSTLHPVTFVLLDLRAYDTLLEVLVLVAVAIAARDLHACVAPIAVEPAPTDLLLSSLARRLLPLFVLLAGYLVWVGAQGPGGAFQAGAVLAGAGVLRMLIVPPGAAPGSSASAPTPLAVVIGPLVFIAIATLTLLIRGRLLDYPEAWTKSSILCIEVALAISIASALLTFFPFPRASPPHAKGHGAQAPSP